MWLRAVPRQVTVRPFFPTYYEEIFELLAAACQSDAGKIDERHFAKHFLSLPWLDIILGFFI